MQANGAGQEQETELSCRNGAQNGDSSAVEVTNGLLPVTTTTNNNGNTVSNNNNNGVSPQTATSNSPQQEVTTTGVKKKKRLSQSEEDVIRLIGQHLHDLGLK